MMKNILLLLLLLVAIVMIVIGFKMKMLPPGLTGLGFIIIALLHYKKEPSV